MGSQDKSSGSTVGDILIHSTAGPISDVRSESTVHASSVWVKVVDRLRGMHGDLQVSLCCAQSAA